MQSLCSASGEQLVEQDMEPAQEYIQGGRLGEPQGDSRLGELQSEAQEGRETLGGILGVS